MSDENIAMDLLDNVSCSSSNGGSESERNDNAERRRHKRKYNMIHPENSNPTSRRSSSLVLNAAGDKNPSEAFKEMVGVFVDPGARTVDSELMMMLSLHQSAREGDVEAVKLCLTLPNAKKALDALDDEKLSPLHYAARYNHFEVIELLLECNADVNVRGDDGLLPIHYAARYYKKHKPPKSASTIKSSGDIDDVSVERRSVIEFLYKNGAKINGCDKYGMTPLHYAAMRGNEVAARDLLNSPDIIVEPQDQQKTTPLHYAALYGHSEIANLLIEAGANLRAVDYEKNTPLHHAAVEGHMLITESLLLAADDKGGWPSVSQMINDKDHDGNTALHLAVDNSHLEVIELLLRKGANVNGHRKNYVFPLHQAATNGNIDIVKVLIDHKASVDCFNIYQSTPLHRAAAYNHTEVIQYLLSKGAKIETKDRDGFTPLLWAVCNGHSEAVSCLLARGADITTVDKSEKSAIFLAAEENRVDVLTALLLKEDAQSLIDYSDKYDNSPLHAAAADGYVNIVKMLLDNGSDISNKNEEGKTPLHIAAENGRTSVVSYMLSRNKVIIGDEDEDSNAALHLAALKGHHRVIKLLLKSGADVDAVNCDMWTALDCAAAHGHRKTVKVLLDEDAPIDPTDRNQTTPLHLAAREGYASVVTLLLDHGADITRRDNRGKNCLDLAIHKNRKEAALAIIKHKRGVEALRNETKTVDDSRDTPIRQLIRRMPDVAEIAFRKCIKTNDLPSDHRNLEVTFNYEFLDDIFTSYIPEGDDKGSIPNNYDENNRVLSTADVYSTNNNELKMNHPLMIMVKSKRQALLGHPLCTSLLDFKWKSFGRYVFYCNLAIYIFFLILLTGYALYETDPHTAERKYEKREQSHKENKTGFHVPWNEFVKSLNRPFLQVGRNGIIVLACFHIIRELFQLYQNRLHYFNLENFMEWTCYVTAFLYVFDFGTGNDTKLYWQWQMGAISVFLAWADLVMIMRKFPFLGIYVVMFTDIMKTFSKFFIIFFLFIIAFALGFHLLLHEQYPFNSVEQSLIKTSVMMIGEFEYDGIFSIPALKGELDYPQLSHILFCIFLIMMSIILMNLLVGLAVDDIKAVAEQAELQRLAMQVDLVLSVEAHLPHFIRRGITRRERTVKPNQRYRYKIFTYLLKNSPDYLNSLANALSYKQEVKYEQLKEQQQDMITSLSKLEDSVKQLNRQNRRLQSLMMTIVQNNNIQWQDEDEFSL